MNCDFELTETWVSAKCYLKYFASIASCYKLTECLLMQGKLKLVPTQPLSTSHHPLRKADNYPLRNTIINVLNLSNIMTWP